MEYKNKQEVVEKEEELEEENEIKSSVDNIT